MRKLVTRTAVITTAAVAVSGVGVAFAAWANTTTGAGASAGNARAKQPVAIDSVTAPTGLYPNQPAAEVSAPVVITVSNPNPYAVTLSGAEVTGVKCGTTSVSGFTFGTPSYSHPVRKAPTATTSPTGTATLSVTNVPDLPEACNNNPVDFAVTITSTSN